MTTSNEELRPIVEAATQGEWRLSLHGKVVLCDVVIAHGNDKYKITRMIAQSHVHDQREQDMLFIKTFNPAKVKAMLDQIDALTDALQMAKHIVDANGTQAQLDEVFAALESVGLKP